MLAGTGLGLTNTPVTNTATASVPAERAGMASGMDMSARMISLALNIAVMGFILLRGSERASLGHGPGTWDSSTPWPRRSRRAACRPRGPILALSRQALAHGFGWVMLYAALGACGFAVLSWRAFGTPPAR